MILSFDTKNKGSERRNNQMIDFKNKDSHELKTVNPYFSLMWNGRKLFEWRKFDRDYKPRDSLILKEYKIIELPNGEKQGIYLDRKIYCNIVFVMANPQKIIDTCNENNNLINSKDWIKEKTIDYDYCLMSINNISRFIKKDERWLEIE